MIIKEHIFILVLSLLHCCVFVSQGRRTSSARSYSRYSYSASRSSSYTSYSGLARYSYRYSYSTTAYRASSVRYTPVTTSSSYYSYYTRLYYTYYTYSSYNPYYGGTCYTSSTGGTYCSTTTTTAAPTPAASVATCGGGSSSSTLSGDVGSFTSHPSWDGTTLYTNRMSCSWQIRVPSGKTIKLNFQSFNIEKTFDHVKVYNGAGVTSSLIGDYYNTQVPPIIYSTSNYLYVTFTTDVSITYTGFQALYESIGTTTTTTTTTTASTATTTASTTTSSNPCSGTQTVTSSTSGTIKSHSTYDGTTTYPNSHSCSWLITGNPGQRVQIRFVNLVLESCYDRVTMYDGTSTSSRSIRYICSTTTPTVNFYSTSNNMYITFITDSSVTRPGFIAIYETGTHFTTINTDNGTAPDNRNSNSSNVCTNYNANANGTALGPFTCPLPFEPDDFTNCCGEENSQYCCKIEDNTPMIVGIIIGVICAVVVLIVLIYCLVNCCWEAKAPPKYSRSKQNWRKGMMKTQMLMRWKLGRGMAAAASAPPAYSVLQTPPESNFMPPPLPPPSQLYGGPRGFNNAMYNDPVYPPPNPAMPVLPPGY